MDEDVKDIFGLKGAVEPFSEMTKTGCKFLDRLFGPVSEEIGFFLSDKVKRMRSKNALQILEKANNILEEQNIEGNYNISPKVIARIIEEGSWEEYDEVRTMWAGLLASSHDSKEPSDENLVFINLLSELNHTEAIFLKDICDKCIKRKWRETIIFPLPYTMNLNNILPFFNNDIVRVDRELDHLRKLGLITGGMHFDQKTDYILVTPHSLGINLIVRCMGFVNGPVEYYAVDTPFDSEEYHKLESEIQNLILTNKEPVI